MRVTFGALSLTIPR